MQRNEKIFSTHDKIKSAILRIQTSAATTKSQLSMKKTCIVLGKPKKFSKKFVTFALTDKTGTFGGCGRPNCDK